MKKEKLSKFIQGGMLSESDVSSLFNVLIVIYCILFITSLILLTKIVTNIKSQLLSVQNTQDLCKNFTTYENDTVRYGMYKYFQDTSAKNKFQKNYYWLAGTELIIGTIILGWSLYNHSTYPETAIFPKFSSVTCIFLISLVFLIVGVYISKNELNSLYTNQITSDYASKLSTLKTEIFTQTNLQQLLSTYNSENIVTVHYTFIGSNNITIANLSSNPGFLSAINKDVNHPLDASVITTTLNKDTSGNPILTIKINVFSGADYNIVLNNLGSDAAKSAIATNLGITTTITLQPSSATSINSYGSLVMLEENILRRLLQSNKTDILTPTDANSEYINLSNNDVDKLIGFIDFENTSPDYKLLQSSVCGTSLCNEGIGIGHIIKELSPENFTVFLAGIKSVISKLDAITVALNMKPTTDVRLERIAVIKRTAIDDYQTTLQTFLQSIKGYPSQLAVELSTLQWDDSMWTQLKTLSSQDDITQCQCNGNPLQIPTGTPNPSPGNPTQANILSILNSLASQNFDDPTETITKNLYNMNIYIICTYVFVSYIIFHILYTIFNKKVLISVYFIVLICIASIFALTSQFPGK
jgi:hypothetical protein